MPRLLFWLSLLLAGLPPTGQLLLSYFVSARHSFCYWPFENDGPPFSVLFKYFITKENKDRPECEMGVPQARENQTYQRQFERYTNEL